MDDILIVSFDPRAILEKIKLVYEIKEGSDVDPDGTDKCEKNYLWLPYKRRKAHRWLKARSRQSSDSLSAADREPFCQDCGYLPIRIDGERTRSRSKRSFRSMVPVNGIRTF